MGLKTPGMYSITCECGRVYTGHTTFRASSCGRTQHKAGPSYPTTRHQYPFHKMQVHVPHERKPTEIEFHPNNMSLSQSWMALIHSLKACRKPAPHSCPDLAARPEHELAVASSFLSQLLSLFYFANLLFYTFPPFTLLPLLHLHFIVILLVALIRVTFLSSLSSMSISPLLARLSSTLFTHWLCCCLSHLVFNLFPIGQVKVLSCLTGSI